MEKLQKYLPLFFFYSLITKFLVLSGSLVESCALLILAVFLTVDRYFLEKKNMTELEELIKKQKDELVFVNQRIDKVKTVVDGLQILRGGISNIR